MDKQQLFENIKRKKSFLCVGLDTDIKKIPEHLDRKSTRLNSSHASKSRMPSSA